MKKEENPAKEALDGNALAQLLSGPGGRQAGAIFLTFGVPGGDGDGVQSSPHPVGSRTGEWSRDAAPILGAGEQTGQGALSWARELASSSVSLPSF